MQTPLVELGRTDTGRVRPQSVLDGQLFVLRGSLQRLGLYDLMVEKTLEGIRASAGPAAADSVSERGFERIHEVLAADRIPAVTDAVYARFAEVALELLDRYIPAVFGFGGTYYYERTPNVRFHLPFDLTRAHRRQYSDFARLHGEGKISAHGPHRDYWLDCPDNAVNIWIAMGRVREGNGLSIFHENYSQELECVEGGNVRLDAPLRAPLNFSLEAGDALLFHANHLHASELNRTDETRYVVSFRVVLGKPHFPRGHHHEYLHSALARAGGVRRSLASVPAYLQASFAADRARRLAARMIGAGANRRGKAREAGSSRDEKLSAKGRVSLAVDELPVGSIRAIAGDACVARLADDRFAAFSRYCPHQGADLSCGFIKNDRLVCPWHNLSFDPATGASPCKSLPELRQFPCEVRDGHVIVTASEESDRADSPSPGGERSSGR
jgi:nitrite reductase/ring-hydroxylating ferredoxin subunit